MPLECLIHFDDNPAKIFYAGQSLSGRVDVTFREPKTVRGKQCYQHSIFDLCR